jgi:hypothetical protein
VVDMFADTTEDGVTTTKAEHEAAYQADLDAKAAESVRTQRDAELAKSDWRVIKSTETGVEMSAEWADYRQALRDITDQSGFPNEIEWPTEP